VIEAGLDREGQLVFASSQNVPRRMEIYIYDLFLFLCSEDRGRVVRFIEIECLYQMYPLKGSIS
jgi:hypothetical protein